MTGLATSADFGVYFRLKKSEFFSHFAIITSDL